MSLEPSHRSPQSDRRWSAVCEGPYTDLLGRASLERFEACVEPMNVLVWGEISGLIRDEFRKRGHNAWSVDLYDLEDIPPHWPEQIWPNHHLVGDGFHWLTPTVPLLAGASWDLLIAMPPCTYLANSGVRWLYRKGTRVRFQPRWEAMRDGAAVFKRLLDAPVKKICVENPVMHKHGLQLIGRDYAQTVQPWQFWDGPPGQGEVKRTCFWLKDLPHLVPTTPEETGRIARVHRMGPGVYRQMDRSLTYPGIAQAMAAQWNTQGRPR